MSDRASVNRHREGSGHEARTIGLTFRRWVSICKRPLDRKRRTLLDRPVRPFEHPSISLFLNDRFQRNRTGAIDPLRPFGVSAAVAALLSISAIPHGWSSCSSVFSFEGLRHFGNNRGKT